LAFNSRVKAGVINDRTIEFNGLLSDGVAYSDQLERLRYAVKTMKSYPQKLCTGAKSLWDTPKGKRKVIRHLTYAIRFLREKRTAFAVSSLKRRKRFGAGIAILAVTSTTGITNANSANYSIDHLKLYAHSRLLDYKEFQCFNKIITKESRWSYRAKNGSHFGLGQMKSKHYRDLDPFRQIDASLKYITNRYQTPCKAWAFHQQRNYY
jgi:hypothetical protein